MKIIVIILLLCLSRCAFSQTQKINDTCQKKLPSSCSLDDPYGIGKADTLSRIQFATIIDGLYEKMLKSNSLTTEEDKTLVMVMNTADWSYLDKQDFIYELFPKITSIYKLFDKTYHRYLYCKYSVCIGRGVGSYYEELGVQYLGNPFACSRYFIRD